jgi:hypothetical protein
MSGNQDGVPLIEEVSDEHETAPASSTTSTSTAVATVAVSQVPIQTTEEDGCVFVKGALAVVWCCCLLL